FSGAHRINHNLLVPVIGDGRDDAVDVLVVEQLTVAACHGEVGPHDFTRERVTAIVEVGGGGAFDTGKLNGRRQQAAALHAPSHHAKAHAIARRDTAYLESFGGKGSAGGGRARLEEFAAGPILFAHGALRDLRVEPSKMLSELAGAEGGSEPAGGRTRDLRIKR